MTKSFNEFRASLTTEDLNEIASKANDATANIDHSNGLELGRVSALVSAITTLELLEKYHNWLQE